MAGFIRGLAHHMGNGWFGGATPLIASSIVAATHNNFSGLYYTGSSSKEAGVRIAVTVTPNARRTRVTPLGGGPGLHVAVTAPPREGRANEALIEALAAHFKVRRSEVRIVSGRRGRRKVVEIRET